MGLLERIEAIGRTIKHRTIPENPTEKWKKRKQAQIRRFIELHFQEEDRELAQQARIGMAKSYRVAENLIQTQQEWLDPWVRKREDGSIVVWGGELMQPGYAITPTGGILEISSVHGYIVDSEKQLDGDEYLRARHIIRNPHRWNLEPKKP